MYVDKGSFFAIVGALAAGGVAGYFVSDRDLLGNREPTASSTPNTVATPSAIPPLAATAGTPVCDDMIGAPAACPPPGYSADEGEGCGALTTKRCGELKDALKPRVAEQAVACVTALNPTQRCDMTRVNLCGHVALMNACSTDTFVSSSPVPSPDRSSDELTTRCEGIIKSCGASTTAPSMRDCRATLAGMTDVGRDHTAACMTAHCGDKGLVGCEAAPTAAAVAVSR
jgi:hypothetical protein